MTLAGKRILITGGSSGVGADMAKRCADLGAVVWIASRRLEALEAVAAHAPGRIKPIVADVASPESVKQMMETAGEIDVLVANAGVSVGKSFFKTTLEDYDWMMNINMKGVFLTLQAGMQQMPRDWGRVIVIDSIAGHRAVPGAAIYAATKHGVMGLVKSVAQEVAKSGITVNAVCPGYLDTEMTDRNIDVLIEKHGMTKDQAVALLTSSNPQGRMIDPSEVTEAAIYLMSDAAKSINGNSIVISGGLDT